MDFVRSNFGTNEPLPVEHFFPHFLDSLLCVRSKLAKKWGEKCSTGRGSFVPNLQNPYFNVWCNKFDSKNSSVLLRIVFIVIFIASVFEIRWFKAFFPA